MYRFLLSARWLGGALLSLVAVGVMVLLGLWQLDRYQARHAINERIDAASAGAPAPLPGPLPPPGRDPGTVAPPPSPSAAWQKVSATGRYDESHQILVRARTVDGQVGFEIVTPLVLGDGSAILVDRGWVPVPSTGDAMAVPTVPPAPAGQVTVVGRVHPSESRPGRVDVRDGRIEVRRIGVPQLAEKLPYPLYSAYLLAEPVEKGFTAIPIGHENDWQNAAYVFQWWLFALLVPVGFWYVARQKAHGGPPDRLAPPRDRLSPAPADARAHSEAAPPV
ncbi:SURF1 family cytochrome oxidase biogenesis protein [Rhizomonospora bruguierae]|uniref:SURF1 family cytochrome oxidase biogenesis protein n=1 Tax=Rhizomonospora bruguierae TaxID=1581705 RepID=UPI0020C01B1E|nr:SURF1 family protein [Micromonospora sp. NBRC 107566]